MARVKIKATQPMFRKSVTIEKASGGFIVSQWDGNKDIKIITKSKEDAKRKAMKLLGVVVFVLLLVGCSTKAAEAAHGGKKALIDKCTGAQVTVSYPLHEICDGDHYFIEGHADLGENEELSVSLVTANTTEWTHLSWTIQSSGILEADLYEDITISGGNAMIPINSNRNSTNTSNVVLKSGATLTVTGCTQVSNTKIGGTGFKQSQGGNNSREDEIVLKQGTNYGRVFRSRSAANIVGFRADWYEHVDNN